MMIEFLERLLDSIKSFPHLREITYVCEMYKEINTFRCNYERNSVSTDWPWWSRRPGVSEAFEMGAMNSAEHQERLRWAYGYYDNWQDLNPFIDDERFGGLS